MTIYFILAIVFVITVHEFGHAWMAYRLGDPTAKYAGRISLNPLRHLDLVGTLMLLMIGIGWGKPVPFNPHNLENPKRDEALIAASGPLVNLIIAIIFAIPFKYLQGADVWMPIIKLSSAIMDLSIILAIFNLLPLPPLDGSKIFAYFVPRKWERHYNNYLANGTKYAILFVLVDTFILGRILGFSILHFVIGNLFTLVRSVIVMGS